MEQNEVIRRYYEPIQGLYNFFWSTHGMHFGLWDEQTRNHAQSLNNTNRLVAELLDINPSDIVLDAGCGIGATARYVAKEYGNEDGPHVTGITVVQVQLESALKRTAKANLSHLVDFAIQDYAHTDFGDESFSKIYGIESICHGTDKADFIKEAHRLLKPDGKLAVVDYSLLEDPVATGHGENYRVYCEGMAVPNIATKIDFQKLLEEAGFNNIEYHDKYQAAVKSFKKMYNLAVCWQLATKSLVALGIWPKSAMGTNRAALAMYKLFQDRIITYGAFVAEK